MEIMCRRVIVGAVTTTLTRMLQNVTKVKVLSFGSRLASEDLDNYVAVYSHIYA